MRPYISTSENGKIIIASVVKKFVVAVGFSSGWAEFMPKKPPPLVPSILIGMMAATGPTTIVCGFAWPLSSVPIAPGSRVVATSVLAKVIGMPCCMKMTPKIRETGTIDVDDDAPHIDEEIADRRLAAEGADDRRQRAEARPTPRGTCSAG